MIRISPDPGDPGVGSRRAARRERRRASPWRFRAAVVFVLVAVLVGGGWGVVSQVRSSQQLSGGNRDLVAAAEPMFALQRGGGYLSEGEGRADDRIVRTSVDGSRAQTVFSAPRIQTYVASGDRFVAAVLEEDATTTLVAGEAGLAEQTPLPLPEPGFVGSMSVAGSVLLVVFTPQDHTRPAGVVLRYSLASRDPLPIPLVDAQGQTRQADNVMLTPDATSAVVQGWDGTLATVGVSSDSADGSPQGADVPLGAHALMLGFGSQNRLLTADEGGAFSSIDVTSGAVAGLSTAPPDQVTGSAQLMRVSASASGAAAWFQVDDGAALRDELFGLRADASQLLISTERSERQVLGICASPDGAFAAITWAPAGAADDGYVLGSMPMGAVTTVFPIDQGVPVADLPTVKPGWCQASEQIDNRYQ